MSFVQSAENHQTVFPLTNSSFAKEHRQGSGIDEKSSSIESCALLFENPYTDILPSIMTHRKNNDEGLPINAASAPKRSLTDQLVDYVKKSKYFVPCSLLSPSKTIAETSSGKVLRNRPIEHPGKRGSLCLSYAITDDDQTKSSILTLHVIRARQLSLTHPDHHSLNTFVKVTLANDYVQSSKIIHGTNSPIYDEKFSIPLNDKSIATCAKRLTISVYHQSISNNKSDLIGCMSFNMKTLLKTSNKTSMKCKWYCLLPESIGRHKRVAMNVESYSSIHQRKTIQTRRSHLASANSSSNGVLINVEIFNRDDVHFGSGYPCTVSEVKSVFASSSNRPMPGDILLQVNEINVSRTQAKAVNKLIKTLPLPITLQLYRRSVPSSSVKLDKIVLNSVEQHQPLNSGYFCKTSEKNLSFSETYADQAFCSSDKPYSHYEDLTPHLLPETVLLHPSPIDDDQSILLSPIHRKISEISDGSESGVGSESNPYSDGEHRLETVSDSYEREALRLVEMEKEFIAQLELGVQFYSRPLKHYLISSAEHGKLFQNIEKILAISRYQLNRLQSLSKATIVNHIGQIFHEKVQLICEAFTRYISGYADACMQLKQLSKCASFQRFIHVNESTLSIEQFLQIPLNHIDNLAHQLDLLCCHCENANDANYLLHVLKELRQCSACYQESSQSQHHCTTTMTLPSAHGTTTVMSNSIEDEQIIDLQNRLHCSRTGKSLTLTGRNRHVIFSGVLLLQTENKTYIETWAILLNDMLLFTQRNPNDARLALICDPIPLNDIVDFRSSSERQDALIFTSTKPTHPYKIRYPSQCLQCAWQTILEQRLKTWQRSMHDETSSADSDLD